MNFLVLASSDYYTMDVCYNWGWLQPPSQLNCWKANGTRGIIRNQQHVVVNDNDSRLGSRPSFTNKCLFMSFPFGPTCPDSHSIHKPCSLPKGIQSYSTTLLQHPGVWLVPAPQKKNINIKQSKWTVRHLVLSLDFSMLVWDFVKLKSSGPLFGRNRRYPGHQSLSFPDDSIASQKGKPSALGVRKLQSIPTKQPAILVSTFAPRLSFTCCDMLQTQLLQHPTALRASFLTLPSPHRAGILCNWIQVPRRPWNVPNLSPLLEPSKIQVLSYKLEIQNWRRISFIPLFGPWSFKCRHKSDKENQLPLHLTVFFKRSYHRHISTSSNMLYSSQVRGSDVTGHPCQCWMLVASVPQLLLPPEASPTLAAPPFAAA